MEQVSFPPLSRVAVCGGTHGNEMSGVYVVREMQRQKVEKVGSASVTTVISNPRAVEVCRRYTDTDLNRCFTDDILSSPVTDASPYEVGRAQELNLQLGPKGSAEAVDLLCDLHNTTSNMGLCIISYSFSDWVCLHIYKHIQKITSIPVRLILLDIPLSEAYSQESLGKHGIGSVFEGGKLEVFTFMSVVDYPRHPETNQIMAGIHPQLQDRDFCLLQKGDPIFLSFLGETVHYEGEEPLYPFFVNERAYYEKNIAFRLARKKMITIPCLQVNKD
ncbi:N-acyl-aromatic-L-amino acid amidohydrolase (carboxylate-forming) B isoform X4 [Hypomesus transpacificus]|uniref:N-acyl-aromatic-L-amino acid amidohydrolase (carboxylate-forming) B isoform X4 n=1 Tax=Hypomesus transpacificus TaxID=137520 RepID=UPI001F07B827|nr:N-acyl-aromatic-L-amino acid amidohydrolase (carboxylate-forming) B isoform X4 [Hypomesus transpacificus]